MAARLVDRLPDAPSFDLCRSDWPIRRSPDADRQDILLGKLANAPALRRYYEIERDRCEWHLVFRIK